MNVRFSQTIRPTGVFPDEGMKRSWYSIFNGEFLANCASRRGVAARFGQAQDIGVSLASPFKQDDDRY